MSVQGGETAPEFELPSHRGETVRLSSFAGQKNVVIAFHPLAFTPVCATQMQSYEQDKSWFDAHQTHLLGLSVDAVPAKIPPVRNSPVPASCHVQTTATSKKPIEVPNKMPRYVRPPCLASVVPACVTSG